MAYLKKINVSTTQTLCFLLAFSIPLTILAQELRVSKIFSDHMVLQRGVQIPIWGEAEPNAEINIFFNGQASTTKADGSGKWELTIPEKKAGGPYEMQVVSKSGTLSFVDIMIGDVWLCSGQSNMEWVVANSDNAENEIMTGNHPNIRHFKVPRSSSPLPENELAGGKWFPSSPETVGDFTAVGYFFAREIENSENIPIGLLNSSWGGSRIEPWIRAEDLGYDNPGAMATKMAADREAEKAAYIAMLKKRLAVIPYKDLGMIDQEAVWAKTNYDDGKWSTMTLPTLWEQAGWDKVDGVIWFRKTLILPKGASVADAILNLGTIDDNDQTWVNGHLVGSTNAYNENRAYKVVSKYLKEGENTITIRVDDTGGGGGIYGDPKQMYLTTNKGNIALEGDWKYKVGMIRLNSSSQGDNQKPTLLYNKMIHPILRFPIKGVLWYQGESNAANADDARAYTEHFKTLITSWRKLWNVGEFPFLYVQLANFMAVKDQPAPSNWALLRESQSNALALPNTGQAVIIDIGEADDIHPRNKQDVGKRLAMAAQNIAYSKEIIPSGPLYKGKTHKDSKIELHFKHVGSGLMAKGDGALKGFAIAGEDKKFVWAKAQIVGNTIHVWSDNIATPVAVRYGWADNPDSANLFNNEGLPASPFRTDNWKK